MWKSATTATAQPQHQQKQAPQEDDDWETDPNFVNDCSEKDQRWGQQKTNTDDQPKTALDLSQLRQQVVQHSEVAAKKNWESLNGKDIKTSYGVKK
jgi:hypothetical protein